MKTLQTDVKIARNTEVAPGYFKMTLECAPIARGAQPGQFITVKVGRSDEVLLRRPLSIHRVDGRRIELLYEILGPGTRLLSEKKKGERVDIIGPLGNGFTTLRSARRRPPVLIAGGMGVAPLVFLAEKLRAARPKSAPRVFLGARDKQTLLCEKEFKKLGCDVTIATDDGSAGFTGMVTQAFAESLEKNPCSFLYACGPAPILREISRIARAHALPAQLSLEAHMACGIGACLGCVVNTATGYKRVCKDGPVFEAGEVIW